MNAAAKASDHMPTSSVLKGILRKRCPRCRTGQVFHSLWIMNANCPVCGIDFYRGDPGYFTGAMYASYAMAIPLISILTGIGYLIFPAWSLFRLVMTASALSTPLIPWIWQYSRVLWIYFDRYFDPEEEQSDQPGSNGQ
jgi:uncharacterized protein (DUF983 family)